MKSKKGVKPFLRKKICIITSISAVDFRRYKFKRWVNSEDGWGNSRYTKTFPADFRISDDLSKIFVSLNSQAAP